MPITPEQKAHVEKNKELIDRDKERIRRLRRLAEGKDKGEFWATLKVDIEASIQTNIRRLEIIAMSDDPDQDPQKGWIEVKALGKALLAYKGILANVEKSDVKVAGLNEAIRGRQEENDSIQQRSAAPALEDNVGRRQHV